MKNPYENALNVVEGACNSLGITKDLAQDIQAIADEAHAQGKPLSTDDLNRHPVMVLYLSQLLNLCTGHLWPSDGPEETSFHVALKVCREKAQTWVPTRTLQDLRTARVALTAYTLHNENFPNNLMHNAAKRAAQIMVANGMGQCIMYNISPATGKSYWLDPDKPFIGEVHVIEHKEAQ